MWFDALPLDELAAKGKTVVRHEGRQILHGCMCMACGPPPPEENRPAGAGHARADAWLEALPRRLVLQPSCWLGHYNE